MLIDRRILLNEQIPLRHVSFWLVIIVITDEILHRVLREEFAEFAIKLGGQRLIRRKHDRRSPHLRNHIGHGERLARACDAQQRLKHLPVLHALHQLRNRRGLIACRRIRLKQFKRRAGVAYKRAHLHFRNNF